MERSYWSSPERVYLLVSAINELSIAFTFSTYVLFLEDLGLTRLEVNLVNVAFYLGRFFLEVPTGVIADYCGRKVSCVTAFALYAVGTVMYWQSATFGWCIASELTLAVGSTCLSGAFNAWIKYEMKLRGKHEGDIHALSARKAGYNQLAVMIGAPLGGLAAWCFSTATPFLMSAIGEAVTMILAILLMREARVVVRSGKTWSDLWSTASRGLKYSYESVPVRRMMIVSAP